MSEMNLALFREIRLRDQLGNDAYTKLKTEERIVIVTAKLEELHNLLEEIYIDMFKYRRNKIQEDIFRLEEELLLLI
jgi:hypothetical protein